PARPVARKPMPGKPAPVRTDKGPAPAVDSRGAKPDPTGRTRSPSPARPGRRIVRRRGAWAWWQIAVVVGAVALAGLVAGLVVRNARMKKQLARLRSDARQQLSRANLPDYQ